MAAAITFRAALTPQRTQDAWQRLLEGLEMPSGGQGLIVVHDGDRAIAGAVALVLPWARERRCVWHELQNLIRPGRETYPQGQRRELIRQGVETRRRSWPPPPRTTSPLERRIKELRRRIRPMEGFGSIGGATHFL